MFTGIYGVMSYLGALAIIGAIIGAFFPALQRTVFPVSAAAFLFAVLVLLALPESAIP